MSGGRPRGHWPTILGSLMHFELSFAVWVLLGVLSPFIADDLGLGSGLRSIVVATPLLAAAVFRIPVGALADVHGPRRVGMLTMAGVMVPLAWGWLGGRSIIEVLGIGVLLGIAGSSLAVAMPLASAHSPPSRQGRVLGIVGIGNSGVVLAALIAPRVAHGAGWHATFGMAMIPVLVVTCLFLAMTREAPRRSPTTGLWAMAREPDCLRLCALYAVTFGGFVGFASYLPQFFVDRFGVARVAGATLTAAAAAIGSAMRPVGGILADRFGGERVLAVVMAAAAGLVVLHSFSLGLVVAVVLWGALLGLLGAGSGAVFQLVPERFGDRVGVVSGLVGAAGGVGGFVVLAVLGLADSVAPATPLGFAAAAALPLLARRPLRALGVDRRAAAEAAGANA